MYSSIVGVFAIRQSDFGGRPYETECAVREYARKNEFISVTSLIALM
jgi:hypothetical protein